MKASLYMARKMRGRKPSSHGVIEQIKTAARVAGEVVMGESSIDIAPTSEPAKADVIDVEGSESVPALPAHE